MVKYHTCTHIRTHAAHTYIHTYARTRAHTHTHTRTCIHTHTHAHTNHSTCDGLDVFTAVRSVPNDAANGLGPQHVVSSGEQATSYELEPVSASPNAILSDDVTVFTFKGSSSCSCVKWGVCQLAQSALLNPYMLY